MRRSRGRDSDESQRTRSDYVVVSGFERNPAPTDYIRGPRKVEHLVVNRSTPLRAAWPLLRRGPRVLRSPPSSRAPLLSPEQPSLLHPLLSAPGPRRARVESALAAGQGGRTQARRAQLTCGSTHAARRAQLTARSSPAGAVCALAHLPGLSVHLPDCPFPLHDESMCKHRSQIGEGSASHTEVRSVQVS